MPKAQLCQPRAVHDRCIQVSDDLVNHTGKGKVRSEG